MSTTDTFEVSIPEPKRIGVWTDGKPIEPKEVVMPKKSSESIDDIPTIPDLDDIQDILEKDVSKAPISKLQDTETANTLAEVGGIRGSVEGIDAALEVLKSYMPQAEEDEADSVWTIDSLLSQLLEKI